MNPQACPPGQVQTPQGCMAQQCPPGQVFNGQMCVAQQSQCPAGQVFNGQACVPQGATGAGGGGTASGGGAAPQPLNVLAQGALEAAISGMATQLDPKLQPVSQLFGGQFQTGQTAEVTVSAEAGKCYAIIGAGILAVQNIDLSLMAAAPGAPSLAQDNTTGPTAQIPTEDQKCMKLPAGLPSGVPFKVTLTVSAGSGPAAAKVFAR